MMLVGSNCCNVAFGVRLNTAEPLVRGGGKVGTVKPEMVEPPDRLLLELAADEA